MNLFEPADDYRKYVLDRYTGIAHCRTHSIEQIEKLRALIDEYFRANPGSRKRVCCVAVCGSLARLEASRASDLDLITVGIGDADVKDVHNDLLALAKRKLKTPLPNPKGVFAEPSSTTILEQSSGSQEESYRAFSQRILFVLESKPVWHDANYKKVMAKIVSIYGKEVETDNRKNYVFLLNDVIRYFRTICVNYQFNTTNSEWGKWPIRNVKLRHSRVLMYFSLVAALGELSTYYKSDKGKKLLEFIELTPLERIFKIYTNENDHSWFRFFGLYDTFLRIMSNPKARAGLNKLDYKERYRSGDFATLKSNSDGLAAEIVRFILDRRHQWSDRFFEYIII